NHCEIPTCEEAEVTVTIPVTVTVKDTDNTPKEGVEVFAFDGETFTGYQGITDENGEMNLTLPTGIYRFRADLGGTQFWSDEENHCEVPSCEEVENLITVTKPVLVTVLDENDHPYAGFEVYAFDGFAPTGHYAVTDENGQASLVLPVGEYRFGADIRGTLFFSDEENHCEVIGCENTTIDIPGGYEYEETTINYTYDSLYRLTDAEYSNGDWYQYGYDAVGNRLFAATSIDEVLADFDYVYDDANRLIEMEEVEYTWDNNGNLLDDGVNEYVYDSANRLIEVCDQLSVSSYTYNGMGDRLTQTVESNTTNYTLDLASGLTQVLYDGENFYTYGLGRISQLELYGNTPEYFITDALGSVRQLTHESSAVLMTQSYDPYGNVMSSNGSVNSIYGYTGEQTDLTGNVYLRARYYNPTDGRFLSRDTWDGDINNPLSLNKWMYVEGNPINRIDPSGHCYIDDGTMRRWRVWENPITGPCRDNSGPISPNEPNWHDYSSINLVCSAWLSCTREEVIDALSRFTYPGQNPFKPVTPGKLSFVAPFGWFPGTGFEYFGAIQSSVFSGGLRVRNVSQPTHIFHKGQVDRQAYSNGKAWYVETRGTGNNIYFMMDVVNQTTGSGIFTEVDRLMRKYLETKRLFNLIKGFEC
ncbi:MAG: hypothetical protein KF758_16680, partial [Anaerolineales bacterium]|nr:hypothetical protein [Anaerolineales bacterium]